MVFYDKTGIRKHVVWSTLVGALVFAVLVSVIGFVHLITAEAYAPLSHGQPHTNDTRFAKTVAFTFDDSPHPTFTPELIEILSRENVPATFFLLGQNVVHYPETARMITNAGFEIGNHSFTHSESVHDSAGRLKRELVATDRVIRDATGRSTVLYRPPYLLDMDVGAFDGSQIDFAPMRWSEEAGYLAVGTSIDSRDWELTRDDADILVDRIMSQLNSTGPNVVLFHDDGADGGTVEAVRRLVPLLKSEGYALVPVSFYFELAPTEVSPLVASGNPLDAMLITMVKMLVFGTTSFGALVGFVSVIAVSRMWGIIALRKTLVPWRRRQWHLAQYREPISVLIPAYNEAANIGATLISVFTALRAGDEILVIDDGSTDNTAEVVRSAHVPPYLSLILIQKENGGAKGAALELAFRKASHDIVICIDADTVVDRDAFSLLTRHFENPDVAAVAGKVYPAKASSTLPVFQYLEYMQGQNLDKEVFAALNAVGIVPGALGAWRKSAVLAVGGFSNDTVVEDQDLTMALLAAGWSVRYDRDAKAYTELPSTVRTFFRQRQRWVFGTLQCAWKYRRHIFSPQRPNLGFVVLPNLIFFNLFLPLLVPLLDTAVVLGFFGWFNLWLVLGPFLLYTAFDMWCAIEGLALERKPQYRLIPLVLWQRCFYRYIMAAAIMHSTVTALAGTLVRWGAQKRRGDCHGALSDMVAVPSPIRISPIRTLVS